MSWHTVIEGNAASELTARRLVTQLRACEAASLAFCRLLERWGKGEAVPATPGAREAALRRAADRVETALAGLEQPLSRYLLELEPGPGLVDYLLGRAALEDLLIHPNIGNLVVLPGGEPAANSSELSRSPMMADLIRELRGRYRDRFIVFDVPPILVGADTLALSAFTDATILLVEECRTRRADIARSCELLSHSNLLGVVLNKSRELPEPEPLGRPKPGFFSNSARLSAGSGDGWGVWTNWSFWVLDISTLDFRLSLYHRGLSGKSPGSPLRSEFAR